MEILDIVDESGVPTGETVEREKAHALGICHRTAHVWLITWKKGQLYILLQKRSEEKDSYPGCYDISSAGHIPAGQEILPSALRELKEELGITAEEKNLYSCGVRRIHFDSVFHGKQFIDNQVSFIYCLPCEFMIENMTLQKEEVSRVEWMEFYKCKEAVQNSTISHCIFLEELDMVEKAAKQIGGEKKENEYKG